MKYIFLLTLLVFSCNTNLQTDYRWIRTWSESTIAGATSAVRDKGNKKWDVEMLANMKTTSRILHNTMDSISYLSKSEAL